MGTEKVKRICGISTLPVTLKAFMIGNLQYVSDHGYESYCISGPGDGLSKEMLGNVIYIPVKELKWGLMSPVSFFKCVRRLYKIFKEEKFDIIQYATSNAALCASVAGWLAKVPVRINLQWGIGYLAFTGWKKWLYYFSIKIECRLSTHVQPDSRGNLVFSIQEKLYPEEKGTVLYNGSACGVDLEKYNIHKKDVWKEEVAQEFHLNNYKIVYGFVGRVVVEKGINELLEAFMNMNKKDACLLFVGPIDDVGRLNQELYQKSKNQDNIIYIGPVSNAAKYYAAFDYMMLPSYQEGFGMSVLEAAALGVPSIISDIKGPTDLIKDGVNGLICDVRSSSSLQSVMQKAYDLLADEYKQMADTAYEIASRDFDNKRFKELFLQNRDELLMKYRQGK